MCGISFIFIPYFVAIIWVFLFPLVNISSGELKPRAFYVDENAILIHSVKYVGDQAMNSRSRLNSINEVYRKGNRNMESIDSQSCSHSDSENTLCSQVSTDVCSLHKDIITDLGSICTFDNAHVGFSVTSLVLQSSRILATGHALEASEIVIVYNSNDQLRATQLAFDIAISVCVSNQKGC